ncbi:MAG: multiheme c-type cytochrome [Armatimonadota bacterium]
MTRLKSVPVVSFLQRHALLFAMAAFVISLVVIGCGGGGSSDSVAIPATGFKQVGATYVGRVSCRDCHANIYDQYAEQPMGSMAEYADTRHVGTNCGACHVTGFGDPTGGKLDGSTPQHAGIGCESCHGPGSKHLTAGSIAEREATITRVPPDKTCWDCHGDRKSTPEGYRPGALDQPYTMVTAETLRNTTASGLRGPHYPAAAFLLGRVGYNLPAPMASPHSTIPNTCQACHQKTISPVTGKVDHGMEAQKPVINTADVNCASCHSGRSEHFVQTGVKEALIELCGEDPAKPGSPDSNLTGGLFAQFVTDHALDITKNDNPDNPYLVAYKGARYNVKAIMNDHSYGVHNPGFARRLIDDAKALLAID